MPMTLDSLLTDIRGCRLCEANLPLGANPIIRASSTAKLMIIGQAPGIKVHQSNIPWNDPSGDRLRDWLQLDKEQFYDERQIAIMPMGFCYPGKGKSGDLPPRPECAEKWHQALWPHLPEIRLTLLIGQYAQNHYLTDKPKTLTETVRNFACYLPNKFPLPHPSPRNRLWLKRNDWFERDLLPRLRDEVKKALS